jgi:mRNA interferase RelE/StbE
MAWTVEVSATATRQLENLDSQHSKRIVKFVQERLARLDNPRDIGKPLSGPKFGELWKYRVGDYRLICRIKDERLVVLVLLVGHRKEIYR